MSAYIIPNVVNSISEITNLYATELKHDISSYIGLPKEPLKKLELLYKNNKINEAWNTSLVWKKIKKCKRSLEEADACLDSSCKACKIGLYRLLSS